MVRIILIQPDNPWAIDSLASHPALGLLYISAYLKARGFKDVEVIDLNGGVKLPDVEADIVGVSASTPSFPLAVNIKEKVEKVVPDAIFVIGGAHPTVHGESCVTAGFDYVVVGEGENAMLSIVESTPRMNKVISCPPIEDLDSLPFPDRDAIDIYRYRYVKDSVRYTSMICSRGCLWGKCAFCCQTWSKPVRFRSPENCIEEMKLIRDKYGFEGIYFYDDCFNLHRPWLRKLCRLAKHLGMKWRCLIRADLTRSQAMEMKNAGCVEVFIGQESGSNMILKNINKGITAEQGLEALRYCTDEDLHVRVGLIIGLPGESLETVEETREWLKAARRINPALDFDYTICTVYPGSLIWNYPERYDITFEREDWSKMIYKRATGSYKHIVSTSHLSSEEIITLHDEVSREFSEWGIKLAEKGCTSSI